MSIELGFPSLRDVPKTEIPLTRKDFVSDQEVRWCPGCGDYSILAQTQKVMPDFGVPKDGDNYLIKERKYAKWRKDEPLTINSVGGWLGVTDKYWLTAMIPDQKQELAGNFRVATESGVDVYEVTYTGAARTIQGAFDKGADIGVAARELTLRQV